MRKTREVQITQTQVEDVICDMCGASCKKFPDYSPAFATLSMHGHYATSYDQTHLKADLCETCFRYLVEVIKSKGGKIREQYYLIGEGCEMCDEERIEEYVPEYKSEVTSNIKAWQDGTLSIAEPYKKKWTLPDSNKVYDRAIKRANEIMGYEDSGET